MMRALLYEYSSVGQSSDIKMSVEFHFKCKAHFEVFYYFRHLFYLSIYVTYQVITLCALVTFQAGSLQQFFVMTIQTLQSFNSISPSTFTKEQIALLASLLSITESILSWEFTPKNHIL